jgi:hypothetical protein
MILFLSLGFYVRVRVRVKVEQDGPCICMYVLNIIQNFILYIGVTYM